jgi:hypothetical protein
MVFLRLSEKRYKKLQFKVKGKVYPKTGHEGTEGK